MGLPKLFALCGCGSIADTDGGAQPARDAQSSRRLSIVPSVAREATAAPAPSPLKAGLRKDKFDGSYGDAHAQGAQVPSGGAGAAAAPAAAPHAAPLANSDAKLRRALQAAKESLPLEQERQVFEPTTEAASTSSDPDPELFDAPELVAIRDQILKHTAVRRPQQPHFEALRAALAPAAAWLQQHHAAPGASAAVLYTLGQALAKSELFIRGAGQVQYWRPDVVDCYLALLQVYVGVLWHSRLALSTQAAAALLLRKEHASLMLDVLQLVAYNRKYKSEASAARATGQGVALLHALQQTAEHVAACAADVQGGAAALTPLAPLLAPPQRLALKLFELPVAQESLALQLQASKLLLSLYSLLDSPLLNSEAAVEAAVKLHYDQFVAYCDASCGSPSSAAAELCRLHLELLTLLSAQPSKHVRAAARAAGVVPLLLKQFSVEAEVLGGLSDGNSPPGTPPVPDPLAGHVEEGPGPVGDELSSPPAAMPPYAADGRMAPSPRTAAGDDDHAGDDYDNGDDGGAQYDQLSSRQQRRPSAGPIVFMPTYDLEDDAEQLLQIEDILGHSVDLDELYAGKTPGVVLQLPAQQMRESVFSLGGEQSDSYVSGGGGGAAGSAAAAACNAEASSGTAASPSQRPVPSQPRMSFEASWQQASQPPSLRPSMDLDTIARRTATTDDVPRLALGRVRRMSATAALYGVNDEWCRPSYFARVTGQSVDDQSDMRRRSIDTRPNGNALMRHTVEEEGGEESGGRPRGQPSQAELDETAAAVARANVAIAAQSSLFAPSSAKPPLPLAFKSTLQHVMEQPAPGGSGGGSPSGAGRPGSPACVPSLRLGAVRKVSFPGDASSAGVAGSRAVTPPAPLTVGAGSPLPAHVMRTGAPSGAESPSSHSVPSLNLATISVAKRETAGGGGSGTAPISSTDRGSDQTAEGSRHVGSQPATSRLRGPFIADSAMDHQSTLEAPSSRHSWDQITNSAYERRTAGSLLYADYTCHVLALRLLLNLLVTPSGGLDPAYVAQFPHDAGLINVEHVLIWHLNVDQNWPAVREVVALVGADVSAAAGVVAPENAASAAGPLPQAPEPAVPTSNARGVQRLLRLLVRRLFDSGRFSDQTFMTRGAFGAIFKVKAVDPATGALRSLIAKTLELPGTMYDKCVLQDVFGEVSILERYRGQPAVCQLLDYGLHSDGYWLLLRRYRCSLHAWRERLKRTSSTGGRESGVSVGGGGGGSMGGASGREPPDLADLAGPGIRAPLYLAVLLQVLDALACLEADNIGHFDLKCSNVLLEPLPDVRDSELWAAASSEPPFRIALADFGEAQVYRSAAEAYTLRNRGTEVYKSPEMLMMKSGGSTTAALLKRSGSLQRSALMQLGAGLASDVWSFGCLAYELLTGETLFAGDYASVTHRVVFGSGDRLLLQPEERTALGGSPELIDLIEFILVRDPKARPSVAAIRERVEAVRARLMGGQ